VAREIGYVSAGTVEFLFDGHDFYFMEMNTRLQVEHTVTEAVTGIDLVEWQLRVAAGERLPLTQDEIHFNGHAIEARVCAEDPERGFLPSSGRLALLEWPRLDRVRVDAGFASGDSVPDSYDSLLGKVIAWGATREEAAARLAAALTHTYSAGVRTNEHWLARILRSPRFLKVKHNIALLDKGVAEFAGPTAPGPGVLALAALAAHAGSDVPARADTARSPWAEADAFTPNLPALIPYRFLWQGGHYAVELEYARGRPVGIAVEGQPRVALADVLIDSAQVAARLGERRFQGRYLRRGTQLYLWVEDEQYEFALDDPRTRQFTASAASGGLTTPLPGVVVAVPVAVGQKVAAGQALMVIEAMKMEHTISAPYAGTVERIHYNQGQRVPEGSELLSVTKEPA